MKQQQSHTSWGFRSLSFSLTLFVAVGIILVGIRFFLDPAARARDFGISLGDGPSVYYGYVKGIRDIFSGLVLLYVLHIRARRITAVLFTMATLIPIVDCISVIMASGMSHWHFYIHGGTALYMAITSALLFRQPKTLPHGQVQQHEYHPLPQQH